MEPRSRNLLIGGVVAAVLVLVLLNSGGKAPVEVVEAADPSIGSGNLTVFLFEDYQCSHCRDYALGPNYQHLLDTWVSPGDVRVVFKHAAFVGPYSEGAAIASRCVAALDSAAWPAWDHDVYAMALDGQSPTPAALRDLSTTAGVDGGSYDACIADPDVAQQVADNTDAFRNSGSGGTPAIIIAGIAYNPNDLAAVDQAIQEALA